MKLLVHDPPWVSVLTPGWMVAVDAGAHAPAVAVTTSVARTAAVAATARRRGIGGDPLSRIAWTPSREASVRGLTRWPGRSTFGSAARRARGAPRARAPPRTGTGA